MSAANKRRKSRYRWRGKTQQCLRLNQDCCPKILFGSEADKIMCYEMSADGNITARKKHS